MRQLNWSRDKSVYMPEFDAEHRNLYELAKEVQEALAVNAPLSVTTPTVRALVAAAEDHFMHEERLMRTAKYRLLNWHKTQHDSARKRMRAAMERADAEDPNAAAEVVEFIGGWLKDHTAVADRMMAAALRAHARLSVA